MKHKGLGIDIIEIDRIKRIITQYQDKFLHRIFTNEEIAYCQKKSCPFPHYAARFAAKEAVAKALGVGIGKHLSFLDIEVCHTSKGQPEIILSSKAKEHFPTMYFLLSLSHCQKYAIASVMVS
ncbi:MAG: holo-ACP synthase [Parachlamydiales bacterium]|nr:holo-ACP synthase [Parachlamydiales bacterium]